MLQKWEKEVEAKTILHPTSSVNVGGSGTFEAEASSTPLGPVPPSSMPSGIVVATPSSHHPVAHTACPSSKTNLGLFVRSTQ